MRRTIAVGSVWTLGLMMVASLVLVAVGCGDQTVMSSASSGDLEVSEQVSFERTAVGETDTQRVVLENAAPPKTGGSVRVSDLRIEQPDGVASVFEPAMPDAFPDPEETLTLEPGESVSLQIEYSPKPGVEPEGELVFNIEGDPEVGDSPVRIGFVTPKLRPELATSPSADLTFASAVGEVDRKYVKFQNVGTDVMEVKNLSVDDSGPFSVLFAAPSSVTCRADGAAMFQRETSDDDEVALGEVETIEPENEGEVWPVDVVSERYAPGDCLVAIIEFLPDDFPPAQSSLSLSTERAGDATIDLLGNEGEPCLEVAPSELIDFGTVEVGETVVEGIRMRNCRPEADELQVTAVEFANTSGVFDFSRASGGHPGLMDGDPNTGVTLTGTEQTYVDVVATPPDAGQFGRLDCGPETDPVFQVYHNGVGSEDGPRELCPEVVGEIHN